MRAGPEEDPATPTPLPSPGEMMELLFKENAIHTAKVRASINGNGRTRKAAEQYEPMIAKYKAWAESKAADGQPPLDTTDERNAINFLHHTVYPTSPDGEMPTDPVISKANFERHLSAVQWQVTNGTHSDKPPHTNPPKAQERGIKHLRTTLGQLKL